MEFVLKKTSREGKSMMFIFNAFKKLNIQLGTN